MKAQKEKNGTWKIQFRYKTFTGEVKKTTRRGFNTKKLAEGFAREFLLTQQGNLDMLFDDFIIKIYYEDMDKRLRKNTMQTKRYTIDLKILPYFGSLRINDIKPADVRKWQSALIAQGYSQT